MGHADGAASAPACFVLERTFFSSRRGFTLAELLTVVAIISLLLAVAVPAFGTLIRNANRRASVDETLALLERARAEALTSGRAAYLVFADESAPAERRFRAAFICVEGEDLALPPQVVTPWRVLPAGVSYRVDAASALGAVAESPAPLFAPPGESGPARALPYIKFYPTGAVAHPGSAAEARLILFRGVTEADGSQTFTQRADEAPEIIALSRFTGCARYQP